MLSPPLPYRFAILAVHSVHMRSREAEGLVISDHIRQLAPRHSHAIGDRAETFAVVALSVCFRIPLPTVLAGNAHRSTFLVPGESKFDFASRLRDFAARAAFRHAILQHTYSRAAIRASRSTAEGPPKRRAKQPAERSFRQSARRRMQPPPPRPGNRRRRRLQAPANYSTSTTCPIEAETLTGGPRHLISSRI